VLNRLVAIKVLKPEYSTDATFVKKFRVEAQSAAGLSHPNIVSVYDVGEENGTYFIVMELVQGITLKNYIDMKGKLDIREALNISVQIASGLSAAHDNRIIHRDIKPQNIIMSRDGKVKVTDFGIAKVADSTTVTTTAAGTVHYISPEQARGGYSDEKSDIYSLGITMYEMLTGRVPFEGETNVAVALLHIQGEMTPPRELEPSIPESFEKIILKCTQKKPDRRYASARELIADLRKVLTHPDGEYVVIAGDVPAGKTIVMKEDDVSSLKEASLHKGQLKKGQAEEAAEEASRKKSADSKKASKDDFEDDDESEEVNPALTKVMMALGIGGFIILAIIIIYIIGHAAGLFGGGGLFGSKNSETATESVTESVTESITETVTTEAETVSVPSVLGKTENEARTALLAQGLHIKVESGTSNDYEKGEIYKQSPEAGTDVSENTTVTVYVSTGKETFSLEDVSGLSYDQASDRLKRLGLNVTASYENSSSVAKDKVIRTSPSANSQVSEGDTITIVISEGEAIKYVTMPYVIGDSLSTARDKIESAGLELGNYSSDYSDVYDEGQVMYQSISSGKSVEEGTSVTLTVSLGPKNRTYTANISVPNPFGQDIEDSDGELQYFTEGKVRIVVEQSDGTSQTVFNESTSQSSIPSQLTVTSSSSASGTAYLYIEGILYQTWSVSFN
jgi:serine/threonine-protein kinase